MLSHMELGSVFHVFDIAAELGYDRITDQAIKLICANLGELVARNCSYVKFYVLFNSSFDFIFVFFCNNDI